MDYVESSIGGHCHLIFSQLVWFEHQVKFINIFSFRFESKDLVPCKGCPCYLLLSVLTQSVHTSLIKVVGVLLKVLYLYSIDC